MFHYIIGNAVNDVDVLGTDEILADKNSTFYPEKSYIPSSTNNYYYIFSPTNSLNCYYENGNEIVLSSITTQYITYQSSTSSFIYNINNTALYTLGAHAHAVKTSLTDNMKEIAETLPESAHINGKQFFPLNFANGNITHEVTTNDNFDKTRLNNKTTYLPCNKTINLTYIPENTIVPVGTIMGWMQVKQNGKWVPEVPYGYYELQSTNRYKNIDCDDSTSIFYNAELAKLQNVSTQIKIPSGKTVLIPNTVTTEDEATGRIIQIIKYSDNWKYHN